MRRRGVEIAQATIEFALVLPLVVMVFLLGVDAVLLARDELLVAHCAREGARRASLTGDPGETTAVVHARGAPSSATVTLSTSGNEQSETVSVTVRWNVRDRLLILGHLGRDITVEHTTVMLREPQPEGFDTENEPNFINT